MSAPMVPMPLRSKVAIGIVGAICVLAVIAPDVLLPPPRPGGMVPIRETRGYRECVESHKIPLYGGRFVLPDGIELACEEFEKFMRERGK